MNSPIQLKSASKVMETGVPIFFRYTPRDPKLMSHPLLDAMLKTPESLFVKVPAQRSGSQIHGEFLLSTPGQYELKVGSEVLGFEVQARSDLDFAWQFGPVLLAVGLVLFALAVWSTRRSKKTHLDNSLGKGALR